MAPHPVRLTVTDDLRRSRLTVFFRLLLAIPHFVWFLLWTIAAVVAGIANWAVTLVAGTPPAGLHGFLSAYVRYSTQLTAYLTLAANPYPGFTGTPGYPVDLEIDGPERQSRWKTGFRLFLAVPAILLAFAFEGGFGGGEFSGGGGDAKAGGNGQAVGIVWTVAVFGWFVCVVLGRMPQGFRDLQAYGLRYTAQVSAYLLVLTERYPNVDPAEPPSFGPPHPVRLTVVDDLRRSRLTVFFRFLLALPHFVWLVLWTAVVLPVLVVNWLVTLVAGRPPAVLHRFLSAYLRYGVHVIAFTLLTANPFPGFTGAAGSYPVDPQLPPPGRQSRWKTLFRLLLAIPAFAVSSSLYLLLFIAAFLGWFAALATGRMPHSLREAQAYTLRYGAQVNAYVYLLTDRYPYSGPTLGEEPLAEPAVEPQPVAA